MTRYHTTINGNIPFTVEEEAEWDAKELAEVGERRNAKWEEIKALRTELLNKGGFRSGPHWYHSDEAMRIEFLGLKMKALQVQIAGGDMTANIVIDGTPTQIKTMDNGYMTVSSNDILAIVSDAEIQTKKLYEISATHKYLLDISPDPANYDYTTGWPAIYGAV